MKLLRAAALVSTVLFCSPLAVRASCPAPDDGLWWDGFKLPILDGGRVMAAVQDGDGIILGGHFVQAGGIRSPHVARWNGSQFTPVGDGLPTSVYALTFWNGRLIAGTGTPNVIPYEPAVYELIDGHWNPLGTLGDGPWVRALAVWNGELYAAGSFGPAPGESYGNVARWDGTQWRSVGTTSFMSDVRHLIAFGSKLVIAGKFDPFQNIAQWDGSTWSGLGAGLQHPLGDNLVTGLVTDGVKLYASGRFTYSGSHTFTGLPQWDGTSWSSLGTTTEFNDSYSLGMLDGGPIGNTGDNLAYWNGSGWVGMPTTFGGFAGPPNSQAAWGSAAAVAFNGIGTIPVRPMTDVAAWDGVSWNAVMESWSPGSAGHYGSVRAALEWNGELVVGGQTYMGVEDHFLKTSGVSRWDGTQWTSLGAAGGGYYVYALTEWQGSLVATGLFPTMSGVATTKNVAQWTGTGWQPLAGGLSSVGHGLAVYQNDLIAIGVFLNSTSGVSLKGVGRWNGTTWSALGSGFDVSGYNRDVPRAVLTYGTDVIVTGTLTIAGGTPVSNIARWNGSAWQAMGTGLDGEGYAMAAFEGDLIVGGDFTHAGGVPAEGIARWSGSSWSAFGDGAIEIEALRVIDGRLYAGGEFRCDDGSTVRALARWTGSAWQRLGSGFDGSFYCIEPWGGDLYVGGSFTWANGKQSWNIARWRGLETLSVPDSPSSVLELAAWPNPAGTPIEVEFVLPQPGRARLVVTDVSGRAVVTLFDRTAPAGRQRVRWGGRDGAGSVCRPGIYFARLETSLGSRFIRLVRI